MRRTAIGQRRHRRPSAASVSLFPFLAVLICTMGALILLLVVIARQARLQAAETGKKAATETAHEIDDLRTQRGLVQWRIEQLRVSLQKTESDLSDARLVLGDIEDQTRRLCGELARLKETYDQLVQVDTGSGRQRDQLTVELRQVEAELADAQRQLDAAQETIGKRRRSFAVVPYRGPHETNRRPIYIECGADAITLQPEGISLSAADFEGPMRPGNPLAAALRAAREFLLVHGELREGRTGEPYPLLLVRPDGIVAYNAARAALKTWGSEIGYELVGADWELAFQQPDPRLAEEMRRAIEIARVRQARLAAAAPRHHGRSGRAVYRAAPNRGGIVRDNGFFEPDDPDPTWRRPSEESAKGEKSNIAPRPGEWRPKPKSVPADSSKGQPTPDVESLAKTQGRNWALPDAGRGSVPITRQINVECHADRLVIGQSGSDPIALGRRTEDSMDELRSAVWQHLDSWGIAGKGMYWSPVLKVRVAPDAQQRFRELQVLLDDSGLILERK